MASAQEKTTPCCIDTSKSSRAASVEALQDWTIAAASATAAAPSDDPIRNSAASMAALIRPVDSIPDQPTKTSSAKG